MSEPLSDDEKLTAMIAERVTDAHLTKYEASAELSARTAENCTSKHAHFWCQTCGIVLEPGHEMAALRAEVETLKREWIARQQELAFAADQAARERDRYRKALQEIVDGATIETETAATIARKALEGGAK